jgi:large subunit ribosomal protein L4
MKKAALRGALTDTLQSGKLVVVDDLDFTEPKTKRAAETITAWNVEGKILLILEQPTDTGAIEKSFRNLDAVRIAYAKGVGVYELIAADKVIVTASALDALARAQERTLEPPATESRNEPRRSTNATGDPEQAAPASATSDDEDGDDE